MSANGILYIYTVYIDDVYRYLILRSITHTGTHHQSLYIKAYGDISNALLVLLDVLIHCLSFERKLKLIDRINIIIIFVAHGVSKLSNYHTRHFLLPQSFQISTANLELPVHN